MIGATVAARTFGAALQFLGGWVGVVITGISILASAVVPGLIERFRGASNAVSYTHLRAHETPEHLVCRLLLEKKN